MTGESLSLYVGIYITRIKLLYIWKCSHLFHPPPFYHRLATTIQETNDDRYTTHHTISTEAVIDDDDGGGGECFPIFAFWLMLDWMGPWSDASRPQHKNISTAAASAAPPPLVPVAGDDMGERQRYAHCKRLQEELQFHSLGLNYTSYLLLLLPSIHSTAAMRRFSGAHILFKAN